MSDLILNWSSQPTTRKVMDLLGMPTPQPLERVTGPWQLHPLRGRKVCIGGSESSYLNAIVHELGADPITMDLHMENKPKVHALIYDATHINTVDDLRTLYDFFHPRIRQVNHCGRVLVIRSTSNEHDDLSTQIIDEALIGFCKSLAKEIGRKGSTSNLITVAEGAENQLVGPLRFFLSQRSAFISGQTLHVSVGQSENQWTECLLGKTAVVTGASRGIGAATAKQLAAEGAHVLVVDVPSEEEALNHIAGELNGKALALDITDPQASHAILEAVNGTLDIIVHNAGITRDKTLGKMDEQQWDSTLQVNLVSVLRITQDLLEQKAISQGGRIILVSSIAGIAGNMGQTNYAASKAGIIGLTQALGQKLSNQGITCNAVAPGFIETRMTRAIPLGIRLVGRRFSNLNQGGLPVDIANAITFISSPGAGGLQGTILRVCGGNLLGA